MYVLLRYKTIFTKKLMKSIKLKVSIMKKQLYSNFRIKNYSCKLY